MAAVITAATDCGIPAVDWLSVWLYPSTESFAYWGRRETDISKVKGFPAYTNGVTIHLDLGALQGRSWGSLVHVLAHEYGHVVHNSLTAHNLKAPHWFREGFAEWVSARILDSLAWRSGEVAIRRARLEVNAQGQFNPSVFQDETSWTFRMGKPGRWGGTYAAAFLAVDGLIRKNGLPAAIEYFKTGQFESSFRQSYSSFEQEFQNSTSDRQMQNTTLEVDKPEWNLGFRWEYQITKSGRAEQGVQEVRGIDTSAQVPVYLLREKNEERLYRMDSLGLLETRLDGIVKTRRQKSNEFFAWPLQLKKEWRNRFELESMDLNRTITVDRKMIVSGIERVEVPAGVFEAIKIEAYDYNSGRLFSEYWFSPKVKWYIKTIRYEGQDTYFTEERLTAFKIK